MKTESQPKEPLSYKARKEELLKYDLKVIEQKIRQLLQRKIEIEYELSINEN